MCLFLQEAPLTSCLYSVPWLSIIMSSTYHLGLEGFVCLSLDDRTGPAAICALVLPVPGADERFMGAE